MARHEPTSFTTSLKTAFLAQRRKDAKTRMHVHVYSGDGEVKFWLKPEIELARNYRLSRIQLKQIEEIIEAP